MSEKSEKEEGELSEEGEIPAEDLVEAKSEGKHEPSQSSSSSSSSSRKQFKVGKQIISKKKSKT